jgi:DnaJ domain
MIRSTIVVIYRCPAEIERTATDNEIKKAYRKQSLIHHPDKVSVFLVFEPPFFG